jgi:hypothetical protein
LTLRNIMSEAPSAWNGPKPAVIIHLAGKEEPRIEVTGLLAQLTSAPDLFPQQTLWPTVVAGAGIEPATYGL